MLRYCEAVNNRTLSENFSWTTRRVLSLQSGTLFASEERAQSEVQRRQMTCAYNYSKLLTSGYGKVTDLNLPKCRDYAFVRIRAASDGQAHVRAFSTVVHKAHAQPTASVMSLSGAPPSNPWLIIGS